MSAFCGCLKSQPHIDNTIASSRHKKGIVKDRSEMDLLSLQKQMAFDPDMPNGSLMSGIGFSFDELSASA